LQTVVASSFVCQSHSGAEPDAKGVVGEALGVFAEKLADTGD